MTDRRTTKARKLVSLPLLSKVCERVNMGVPLTRVIRQLNLDISRPCLASLLDAYITYTLSKDREPGKTIFNSLFPPWMPEGEHIVMSPDSWCYVGRFPLGYWTHENDQTIHRSRVVYSTP
jgi:hypothetical protein